MADVSTEGTDSAARKAFEHSLGLTHVVDKTQWRTELPDFLKIGGNNPGQGHLPGLELADSATQQLAPASSKLALGDTASLLTDPSRSLPNLELSHNFAPGMPGDLANPLVPGAAGADLTGFAAIFGQIFTLFSNMLTDVSSLEQMLLPGEQLAAYAEHLKQTAGV